MQIVSQTTTPWLFSNCLLCVAVAMKLLSLGPEHIGSLWTLTKNPNLAKLGTGYSYISGVMLLAGLPITLLVRTMTVSAAVLLCNNKESGKFADHQQLPQSPLTKLSSCF